MTYTADDWRRAMDSADGLGWDQIDMTEFMGPFGEALFEAYDSDKIGQQTDVLEAALVAAHSRYGSEWDIPQFESVWTNYVEVMDDWAAVAEDYLDDHYPGLVTTHGKHMDLEEIGREYARDRQSEQYITIPDDGRVFIFNKR